jgi:hypothetical protein
MGARASSKSAQTRYMPKEPPRRYLRPVDAMVTIGREMRGHCLAADNRRRVAAHTRECRMSTFKRILVIGAITATGLAAGIGSTAHAAAAPGLRVVTHAANGQRLESVKNVQILKGSKKQGGFKFKANKIKVPDCNNPNVTDSVNITNNTTVSQGIVFEGTVIATEAPGDDDGFCASGGPATIQVSLDDDASAVLTINIVH